jgi:hypothetical protein
MSIRTRLFTSVLIIAIAAGALSASPAAAAEEEEVTDFSVTVEGTARLVNIIVPCAATLSPPKLQTLRIGGATSYRLSSSAKTVCIPLPGVLMTSNLVQVAIEKKGADGKWRFVTANSKNRAMWAVGTTALKFCKLQSRYSVYRTHAWGSVTVTGPQNSSTRPLNFYSRPVLSRCA